MKKIITGFSLMLLALISVSAYVKYSSGIAGYTASPGELSCNNCHSGGAVDPLASITMSASPSFSNNAYSPNAVYDVSVQVSASGYSKFGFGCEVLNSLHASTGTLQASGTDVQTLNAGSRVNVTHTGPKPGAGGAIFSFKWLAPASGVGAITFYIAGNSVNGDHSTGGDFPVPPVSFSLNEGVAVVTPTVVIPDTLTTDTIIVDDPVVITGLKTHTQHISQVYFYPVPVAHGVTNFSCALARPQLITAHLLDLNGKSLKTLLNEVLLHGYNTHALNLQGIEAGVYFIRITANGYNAAQKLIVIQ